MSVRVQSEPFDMGAEVEAFTASAAGAGAVVTFSGLVRDEGGTLSAMENEANISWFLRRYPQFKLQPPMPNLGGPGLTGRGSVTSSGGEHRVEVWLDEDQASLVQRFGCGTNNAGDTVAFFIAKLQKLNSVSLDDYLNPLPQLPDG